MLLNNSDNLIHSVCAFVFVFFAGVRCGGKLHGRVHQTAGEAERLRGGDHGASGTSRRDQFIGEGGRPGVRVDGQLPVGKKFIILFVITVISQ